MHEAEGSEEPSEASLALIGQIVAERYRVEALLGEGGMGAVYRAEHVAMRKKVALKVLHREMTAVEEARLRFEREAIASGRIDHPNVVNATDFGKLADGSSYLVLDYIAGRSLSKVLKECHKLTPERALHIARQLVSALTAAHAAGVVHRDLKPDNLMLIEQNGDPDFVKVLDFGIAKVAAQNDGGTIAQLTQHGSVFGTPDYMSPEQAAGTGVDYRSDLYTVGVMLFEMLTGETPFHADNILVILTRHLTEAAPELPADLPEGLRSIVRRLLQKAPADRYPSAADLLEALGGNRRSQKSSPEFFSAPDPEVSAVSGVLEVQPTLAVNKVARLKAELSSLGEELVAASTRALESSPTITLPGKLRTLATRRVSLARREIPLWSLAAGAALLGLCLVVAGAWLLRSKAALAPLTPEAREAVLASEGVSDEDLAKKAAAGDALAIGELEKQPANERSAGTWLSLGHGYATVEKYAEALSAYQAALAKNPEVRTSETVLSNVLRAAWQPEHGQKALEFCASQLGATGADLLYFIWMAKPPAHDPDLDTKAKQLLLDKARPHASPALEIALALQTARTCADTKDLLPKVTERGDSRITKELEKRRKTSGCGFLGLSDCYGCLRRGTLLDDALTAVRARPAPEFKYPAGGTDLGAAGGQSSGN